MIVDQSIRDVVRDSLSRYAEYPAYRLLGSSEWKYHEVGRAIVGLQRRLAGEGIGAGDRVAILSENQPAWPAAYLAITTAGAIAVPILPEFSEAEVAGILEHSGASVILASKKQSRKLQDGERVAIPAKQLDLEEVFAQSLVWEETRRAENPETVEEDDLLSFGEVTPASTAVIIYTSGTTGHSKGVVLSHGNLTSNVQAAAPFAAMSPGERLLSILPLAHTYECTLGMLIPFAHGACVTYLDRPASPSVLARAFKEVQPHLMLSVPLLIEKLVRARVMPKLNKPAVKVLTAIPGVGHAIYRSAGKKLIEGFGGNLRFFGIGGAPLAPDVERVLKRCGFPYAIGYGLTETAPLLAGTSPSTNHLRSTGVPVEGTSIRIHEGEIQARGPNIMQGYYRDPDRTAEVMTEDGWFRTGDIGEFDDAGRLYVKGRSKTVILGNNGENIYPEAIEAVLNQFEGVEESLVLQRGSKLVARVRVDYETITEQMRSWTDAAKEAVGRAGSAAGQAMGDAADKVRAYLEDVRKHANERLSSFSRIADVEEQKEPFEKTPTSKIKRYKYQD